MAARALAAALLIVALGSQAAAHRSRSVRADFQRNHPCPSTGLSRGACPGYQVDHHTPLCIGGKDEPANLRWLTIEEHKAKTRSDVRLCRVHP